MQNINIDILASDLYENILSAYDNGKFNASGKTRAKFELRQVGDAHYEILGANTINILEKGRAPGRVPKQFYLTIYKWSQTKGLNFNKTQSFFIARRIAKEGTKAYRTGEHRDIITEAIKKALSSGILSKIKVITENLL